MVVEDDDLEVIVERAAGLDVHKDVVVASVRIPAEDGSVVRHRAEFATFTDELLALRDWLVGLGVTRVGMEATGVYWKPVFYALESSVESWLLNARHMHNVPGRKTDMADADWICGSSASASSGRASCLQRPSGSCAASLATARLGWRSAPGRRNDSTRPSKTPE